MNHSKDRKKRFVSLRTKAFKVILAGSLLLILAGTAAGLLLHTYTSLRHYKDEAKHLIDTTMLCIRLNGCDGSESADSNI